MPWPVPSPASIAERMAGGLEIAILKIRPFVDPKAISRSVRSAKGALAQVLRVVSLETREAHDHISWWGRQYFIDTVEDEMVLRHAAIWGIDQRAAKAAVGYVTIEGVAGTPLPADLELSVSDARRILTSATATIGIGGTVDVIARAAEAGTDGNIEAGIRLSTVLAYPTISKVTVTAPGFAGGVDEEDLTSLQSAVLAHIRQRPHGGAGFDYPTWVSRQFDSYAVSVQPGWIGRGSVGVIIAMNDIDDDDRRIPRVPTDAELDAILAYLGAPNSQTGTRPVTAHLVVLACELQAVPISIRLRPDTTATRLAVTDAYARFIATLGDDEDDLNEGPIGARIEPSRLSEALSAASGEYAHDLTVPAAPLQLAPRRLATPGLITFLAAT